MRRRMMMGKNGILPEGYTRVEYLVSDGASISFLPSSTTGARADIVQSS